MKACYELREAMGDGEKRVEKNEEDTVRIQRRAYYLLKEKEKGERIEEKDIFPLRPVQNGAVLPYEKSKVIGKKLKRDKKKEDCLLWEDLEDA